MTTSPVLTRRTVVPIVADDELRRTVVDLAELAGADVPDRPWDVNLHDPNCILILGEPLDEAIVASLDAATRERAILIVADAHEADGRVALFGTQLALPRQTDELLALLSHLAAAAPIARIASLHGGAGATRLAACLARLAAKDAFRVAYIDADPRAGAASLLEIHRGDHYAALDAKGVTWADIGDGRDLLPLRVFAGLPRVNGVSLLTGGAPEPAICWRVATALRHACDLVVVDGCLPLGPLSDTRADIDIVVGTPSAATVRAFHLLTPDEGRILALRTPGPHPKDLTAAACKALRTVTYHSERHPDRDADHGIAPGDRPRSATMLLARQLWREVNAA